MSINEEKLEMWCKQVDKRLDRLEGKNCKPKEPYIGDGLERKLVRDWAFTYAITIVWVQRVKDSCLIKLMDFDESRRSIVIDSYATIADGQYTIDELCGEEEK